MTWTATPPALDGTDRRGNVYHWSMLKFNNTDAAQIHFKNTPNNKKLFPLKGFRSPPLISSSSAPLPISITSHGRKSTSADCTGAGSRSVDTEYRCNAFRRQSRQVKCLPSVDYQEGIPSDHRSWVDAGFQKRD